MKIIKIEVVEYPKCSNEFNKLTFERTMFGEKYQAAIWVLIDVDSWFVDEAIREIVKQFQKKYQQLKSSLI